METDTISKLNFITQEFYTRVAPYWNDNPDYFWAGWEDMVQYLPVACDLNLLDLGCGNGRFANFVDSKMVFESATYLGLDSDQWYIHKAGKMFANLARVKTKFEKQDFLVSGLDSLRSNHYDLVTLFGLLHHIPSRVKRLDLMREIYDLMPASAVLVFTLWNFTGEERLKKRIVDLNSDYGQQVCDQFGLDKSDLEAGDYILDWVKYVTAYRYAHYFGEDEIDSWRQLGFREASSYLHDGRFSLRNKYFVWVKL
jgi:SAM-dependent methyltransferase